MNIYSIKEIVDATNSLLKPKLKKTTKEDLSPKEKQIKINFTKKPTEINLSSIKKKKIL